MLKVCLHCKKRSAAGLGQLTQACGAQAEGLKVAV